MTRRIAAIVGGVAVLGVAAIGGPAFSESGVTVKLFQFQPGQVEVKAGTRVAFSNQDDIEHTATAGTPESPSGQFDIKLSGKGATGTVQLAKPGVYPYFCARHQSMRGEIRVE